MCRFLPFWLPDNSPSVFPLQLVQTGKALRASRRDSQGVLPPVHVVHARLPDTIKAFHAALDDVENDIVKSTLVPFFFTSPPDLLLQMRAKSVLLRDLNELKAQKAQIKPSEQSPPEPEPVEPQSKPPMAIGLDSPSPTAPPKDQPTKTGPASKPVAPLADMGMSLPDAPAPDLATKGDLEPACDPLPATPDTTQVKVEGGAAPPGSANAANGQLNTTEALGSNSGLNFNDMEFTLAPNNESQGQGSADAAGMHPAEPSFDLASFAPPADGGSSGNMASLENMLPASVEVQAGGGPAPNAAGQDKTGATKASGEAPDAAFADIFAGDEPTDGMDFDFSLDGGMGGDTFDDLMNDRDNTFELMEHGDIDATFFGIDKTDEN